MDLLISSGPFPSQSACEISRISHKLISPKSLSRDTKNSTPIDSSPERSDQLYTLEETVTDIAW